MRDVLDSHGTYTVEVIEREMASGITEDRGADSILSSNPHKLGHHAEIARLDALERIEGMRAYRSSLSQQYQKVASRLARWRWTAAKNDRMCAACLAIDGEVFPID